MIQRKSQPQAPSGNCRRSEDTLSSVKRHSYFEKKASAQLLAGKDAAFPDGANAGLDFTGVTSVVAGVRGAGSTELVAQLAAAILDF